MKLFRTLLLAAGLLAGTTASAQFFQAGSDPFSRWSEMGTEHYRIIYPRGLDSLARAYVIDLEQWQPTVGASAGLAPGSLQWGRTPVILHPWHTRIPTAPWPGPRSGWTCTPIPRPTAPTPSPG